MTTNDDLTPWLELDGPGERVLAGYVAGLHAEINDLRVALRLLCQHVAPDSEAMTVLESWKSGETRRAPHPHYLAHMARHGGTLAESVTATMEAPAGDLPLLCDQWLAVAIGDPPIFE